MKHIGFRKTDRRDKFPTEAWTSPTLISIIKHCYGLNSGVSPNSYIEVLTSNTQDVTLLLQMYLVKLR